MAELIALQNLFDIEYGNGLSLNKLEQCSSLEKECVNFVSRTSKNNGVSTSVKIINEEEPFDAGLITVAVSGNVMEAFVQPKPFYTAYHVMVLTPKQEMRLSEKLFYCQCIFQNRFRFSYGRQANRTLPSLTVPKKPPGWVYENEVPDLSKMKSPVLEKDIPNLNTVNWKPFIYKDLFEIKKGKRLTKANMSKGDTPFIGAIEFNNGWRQHINRSPIHDGNTITVNYNGSVAEAFYQPVDFWASDDVNVLYPRFPMSKCTAMFLCCLIRAEKYRYSYGRKWHLERMKESTIKLPVNSSGDPDWVFMENYIKSLPFSSSI